MDKNDQLNKVHNREDLVSFLEQFLRGEKQPWEHEDTASYLDAVAAVVDGLDGRYRNRNQELPEQPTWQMIAEILSVATMYE